jgi:hypothetical protein
MKPLKSLKKSFVILFVSLLSSCGTVEIKNSEWCGDLGASGATCFNTLNDETRDLPADRWEEERFGMLCTKSENFSEWSAAIMKLCRAAKWRCRYEDKKQVIIFMNKVDSYIKKTELQDSYLTF